MNVNVSDLTPDQVRNVVSQLVRTNPDAVAEATGATLGVGSAVAVYDSSVPRRQGSVLLRTLLGLPAEGVVAKHGSHEHSIALGARRSSTGWILGHAFAMPIGWVYFLSRQPG